MAVLLDSLSIEYCDSEIPEPNSCVSFTSAGSDSSSDYHSLSQSFHLDEYKNAIKLDEYTIIESIEPKTMMSNGDITHKTDIYSSAEYLAKLRGESCLSNTGIDLSTSPNKSQRGTSKKLLENTSPSEGEECYEGAASLAFTSLSGAFYNSKTGQLNTRRRFKYGTVVTDSYTNECFCCCTIL